MGRLRELLPLDGLYLPMHGAMFVEGMFDAEGDWIGAARDLAWSPTTIVSARSKGRPGQAGTRRWTPVPVRYNGGHREAQ